MTAQQRAVAAVRAAVLRGDLAPVRTLECVDCGKPAANYDHRDYTKPLDVEPVCSRCNTLRGRGAGWEPLPAHRANQRVVETRIYVTPRHADLVKRAAKVRGVSFSQWARECLLLRALEVLGPETAERTTRAA